MAIRKDVNETMKKNWMRPLLLLLALLLLAGCGLPSAGLPEKEEPDLEGARQTAERCLLDPEIGGAAAEPETEPGRLLAELLRAARTLRVSGDPVIDGDGAAVPVTIAAPDPAAVAAALAPALQEELDARMEAARRTDELLEADLSLREELLPELGLAALEKLAGRSWETAEQTVELKLRREDGAWSVSDAEQLRQALCGADYDALAADMLSEAAAALVTAPKHYVMPLDMKRGETPDPDGYLVTEDPDEVLALLARPEAQRLLEGKELIWSPETELFPNSQIRCYLDETILVIVWQEVTAFACGTYAEIVVADGSQLGRRIAEDDFLSEETVLPTEFAELTQAVLVIGGDYYRYPGRWNGICVYEGQVCRFEPDTSDCCFVTDQGELLFVRRGQFETEEEAAAYIEENNVRFSLCFGPAVIEDGENVTPEFYRWGEIYDRYARALLGLKEEKHYLTCAINAKTPGYFNLVTLRDAVDAMLEHGCTRAYTLDGGQTATIVLGGELINTVQFGIERSMSDVVFFASALPPKEEP